MEAKEENATKSVPESKAIDGGEESDASSSSGIPLEDIIGEENGFDAEEVRSLPR